MERFYTKSDDIKIRYNADKYKVLEKIFTTNKIMDLPEFTFYLALFGYHNNICIPLDTVKGEAEHTFSRVSYSRSSVEYDAYFGLFTILANQDKNYDEVINHIAFEKTSQTDKKYSSMTNVQTYYGYVLGGIEPLYDIVSQYDVNDYTELFDSLYSYLLQDISEITAELNIVKKEIES